MNQKRPFDLRAGQTQPDPLFLLRQTDSHVYWGGEDWVAEKSAALHFQTIEQAFTTATNEIPLAVSLLVLFPNSSGHLMIPIDPTRPRRAGGDA